MNTSDTQPAMALPAPTYLGDGVYAKFDEAFGLVLTTGNHEDALADNRIVLEPEVSEALLAYIEQSVQKPNLPDVDTSNRLAREVLRIAENQHESASMMETNLKKVGHLLPLLSESAVINPYGGTMWFTVKTREDVQILLQLAPRWEKTPSAEGIDYIATVGDDSYRIQTIEGALPPTCHLVEEEVLIPAQAERLGKRMVLKCTKPEILDTPAP